MVVWKIYHGMRSLHQADCTDTGGHTIEDRHHRAQCHGHRRITGAAPEKTIPFKWSKGGEAT